MDLYEAYWLYVDGVRCVGPVLKQSEATKDDTDCSALARHYNHFYEKKEEHKQKCSKLPGTLPKYKDQFEEPRGDVRKVPKDNLADLGISLEEGDDPIWLPPEYELPPVWENDLETMDGAELRDLVRTLRAENKDIQDKHDELQEQLSKVARSLSNYLDLKQDNEAQQTSSPRTCEKCGKTFESKAAKHGHSGHCEGSDGLGSTVQAHSQTKPATEELEQLAEGLPELNKQQSAKSHENVSAGEELENLNHLLQGSL